MVDSFDMSFGQLKRIDRLCDDFEQGLVNGQQIDIESIVSGEADDAIRDYLLAQLVITEVDHHGTGFSHKTFAEYRDRFPHFPSAIESAFRSRELTILVEDLQKTVVIEKSEDPALCLEPGEKFGKYEIINCIGKGSFGVVYHALDSDLDRDVALKLSRYVESEGDRIQQQFVDEAKNAARIKANGVATIYDLFTDQGRICIVQEFVDGCSLNQLVKQQPLSIAQSVRLIIDLAEAIGGAHENEIYHRDIKPGNIIINRWGKPILVDFGLAVRTRNDDRPVGLFGTPTYMSPEQVRGESNRTNSTTDIWALGVVLYELLTGVKPFGDKDNEDLFESIQSKTPPALYKINSTISHELNRITLKCLAKRQRDRYPDAQALAKDLFRYLNESFETYCEYSQLVPKGLRSFAESDHGFFLSLVPGPKDHRGIPESVNFWAEQIDNDQNPFPVGLIYGTSGCGKSSFVRAGLIPQLPESVKTIYVEANQFETELRIFEKLRQMFPSVAEGMSLPDTLASIRDQNHLATGEKLLIVVDQFEQWLSNNMNGQVTQLGNSLRHCDGEHIQTLLLVREDFWPVASRFMQQIEVPVVENRNCRSMDLFDRDHAIKLLFQLGKAHRRFNSDSPTAEERQFLQQAVAALSENDKVVSVRLAMFAEAFKDKDWNVQSLSDFGGADGAGVAFLNETFVISHAPADFRIHKKAARNCLQQLLPAVGSNLKGSMQPRSKLLTHSGYSHDRQKFEHLMNVLEQDLKLITAIEPVRPSAADSTGNHEKELCYQLSHDYLVPVIRRWNEFENSRHLQGRVESRMAEVAEIWGDTRHQQYLPTWWETVKILAFSRWDRWSSLQQQMMDASLKKHAVTSLLGLLAIFIFAFIALGYWQDRKAATQVDLIKSSLVSEIETQVELVESSKHRLVPAIQQEMGRLKSIEPVGAEHQLEMNNQNFKLAYALAKMNDSNWDDVEHGIDVISVTQIPWLAKFLNGHNDLYCQQYTAQLEKDVSPDDDSLFRKSIAMAEWGQPKYLAHFLSFKPISVSRQLVRPESNNSGMIEALNDIVNQIRMDVFVKTDLELKKLVTRMDGVINDKGGLALSVPVESLDELLIELFKQNYWPTSVRPYYFKEKILVAVAFDRGFCKKKAKFDESVSFFHGLSSQQLLEKNAELAKADWQIIDVSQCSDVSGSRPKTYSGLWLQGSPLVTQLEFGIEFEQLKKTTKEKTGSGFQIERAFCSQSGKGAAEYCVIWSRGLSARDQAVEATGLPTYSYAAMHPGSMIGRNIADCQLLPIDLSRRDRLSMESESRRFKAFETEFLLGDTPIICEGTKCHSMTQLGFLFMVKGDLDTANLCFEKVVEQNPQWLGRNLEYLHFLSRLGNKEGFNEELDRIRGLKPDDGARKIKIPMAELRLAVVTKQLDSAKKQYDEFMEKFKSLAKEYKGKPESYSFVLYSEVRAKLIFATICEGDEKERVLDEAVAGLHKVAEANYGFMLLEPDFDILRSYDGFHQFICKFKHGHRTTVSHRIDPGVTSRVDVAESRKQLLLSIKKSMEKNYLPKIAACQHLVASDNVICRVVSEKRADDKVNIIEQQKRLARAAMLLDYLGQPQLREEIEKSKFGNEVVQYLIAKGIDP